MKLLLLVLITHNAVSSVIIDVPVRQVTEGNSVSVCVLLRQVSLRGVNAVLNASGISATGEDALTTINKPKITPITPIYWFFIFFFQ